ncbi:RAB7A-interacting MON1-CCZ1 complex subunit 1-like isoform X2 [Glandiceps talaboti]
MVTNDSSLHEATREYVQALLDFTFFDENLLVDEEFPEDCAEDRVRHILVTLSDCHSLVTEVCGPNVDIIDVLGVDIVECIHWRRGALIYMYCHTIHQDIHRLQRQKAHFIKMLHEGVDHISAMLNTRSKVVDEMVPEEEDNTLKLIHEGVFSDTHLLALMYAGEMCYWFTMATKDQQTHQNELTESGKIFLQKYINVVNGPMKEAGWDCSRAEQLLQELCTNTDK